MRTWSGNGLAEPRVHARHSPTIAALIGTSMDYLLRFYAEALNRAQFHDRRWVASAALLTADVDLELPSAEQQRLRSVLDNGRSARDVVVQTEKFSDDVLCAAFELAQLDSIFRAKRFFGQPRPPSSVELADLRSLVSLLPHQPWLVATRRFEANPTFGAASRSLGGADADAIVDNVLVDVKTILTPGDKRAQFRQLATYFALATIHAGGESATGIDHLCVYLARHGEVAGFDTTHLLRRRGWRRFISWLSSSTPPRR